MIKLVFNFPIPQRIGVGASPACTNLSTKDEVKIAIAYGRPHLDVFRKVILLAKIDVGAKSTKKSGF